MKVWAVSMVKDEADIIQFTLEQLINERIDGIVIADNGSTDGTRKILGDVARRSPIPVVVVDDPDPAYYQSDKMTRLARRAFTTGRADWIVPFDADELWVANGGTLRDELLALPRDVLVAGVPLYNHWTTALDPEHRNPFRRIVYRERKPGALPKVACRWREDLVIDMGNHGASYGGAAVAPTETCLEIRHFPYRTPEQFVRKAVNGAAAYAKTDLPHTVGSHWRQYGELIDKFGRDSFIRDVYDVYYHFVSPTDAGLVLDPAPHMRWPQA